MISQKYINGLGFKTIEDIFEYVVDSKTNGMFSQAAQLVHKMSLDQHNGFVLWLRKKNIEVERIYLKVK